MALDLFAVFFGGAIAHAAGLRERHPARRPGRSRPAADGARRRARSWRCWSRRASRPSDAPVRSSSSASPIFGVSMLVFGLSTSFAALAGGPLRGRPRRRRQRRHPHRHRARRVARGHARPDRLGQPRVHRRARTSSAPSRAAWPRRCSASSRASWPAVRDARRSWPSSPCLRRSCGASTWVAA